MVYNSKIRLQTKRDQNIPAKDGFEWYHELFCKTMMFICQVLIEINGEQKNPRKNTVNTYFSCT